MNRARFVSAATFAASLCIGPAALAEQAAPATQPPPMKSVLAGKKLTPPIRGDALVDYTSTKPTRIKDNVVTKFTVRNPEGSKGPIARLTVDETWYDKSGAVITGGRGVINGLLQPGEIQVITIETPWKNGMSANNYRFSHANGAVKPQRVAKLEVPPTTAKAGDKPAETKK